MVSSIIMQIRDFLQLVAQLPGWLLYFGVPALLVVTGLILAVVHADRAYPPVALFLGAVGLFLFASIAVELTDYAVWAAVYLAVAALVRLLFLIPFPKKKEKDRRDDLYDAFYAPLEEEPLTDEDASLPSMYSSAVAGVLVTLPVRVSLVYGGSLLTVYLVPRCSNVRLTHGFADVRSLRSESGVLLDPLVLPNRA